MLMPLTWQQLLEALPAWVGEIEYNLSTPDLWEELRNSRELLTAETDNTPFTAEEQAAIAARIEEVKAEVREQYELPAEQLAGVDQNLDDLKEASERVGKKDWRVMLYGAAFGMIVNDAVPPHVVQGIITTVITGLGHLFGLGGVPPALPPQA